MVQASMGKTSPTKVAQYLLHKPQVWQKRLPPLRPTIHGLCGEGTPQTRVERLAVESRPSRNSGLLENLPTYQRPLPVQRPETCTSAHYSYQAPHLLRGP